MKLFRRVDTQTGIFIEESMFESHPFLTKKVTEKSVSEDTTTEKIVNVVDNEGNPILDPQYIAEPVPPGFYWPKWDGEKWVEGGEAPEPLPHEPNEQDFLLLAITELDMQREQDKVEQQIAMAELAEMIIGGGM